MTLPLLFLTSVLAIPQADRPNPDAFRIPLPDRVLFDDGDDGALWALGHTYKASLDETGLCYVPFLGSDSDGDARARFALASISVGGRPLELESAAVRREGDALVLDRGPLVERYEFELEQVEQVLHVDLDGLGGELRIAFDVQTDLAQPLAARAPFRFGHAGRSIDVGAAFVVAADDSKVAVESSRTAGGYEIVVPAELVAASGDSIVIDPVISSGTVLGSFLQPYAVADVAAIGSLGYFFAVQRVFSANDGDIFVYQVPATLGTTANFVATVDISTTNWVEPAIAGIGFSEDLMVVATRGVGTSRRVWGRHTTADGSTVGTPFAIGDTGLEAFSPDVGAETDGSIFLKRFMVTWIDMALGRRQTVVRAVDRNGLAGPLRQVDEPSLDSSFPSISNGSGEVLIGGEQTFRLAFMQTDANGLESIWSADVDRDGQFRNSRFHVADSIRTQGVSVAGSNTQRLDDGSSPYVVVWDSGPTGGGDVLAAVCADGSVRGDITNVSRMSDDRRQLDQRRPAVAATETQWLITYQERPFVGEWRVRMTSGGPTANGFGLGERNKVLGGSGGPEQNVAVVGRYEARGINADSESGFAVWVNESGLTSVEGAYLEPFGDGIGVSGVQYCVANDNTSGKPAWVAAYGNGSVSSNQTLICTDAPAGTPCFFLTSRQSNFVPNLTGSVGNLCLGGLGFGRFSNQVRLTDAEGRYAIALDPQSIAQPNGTVAAVPGETWHFQAWFRDSAGGAATSNLSNGVAIEFRP